MIDLEAVFLNEIGAGILTDPAVRAAVRAAFGDIIDSRAAAAAAAVPDDGTRYRLTIPAPGQRGNAKVGPIPYSTTGAQTCPPDCGLAAVCYAKNAPLVWHWDKITQGKTGFPLADLVAAIRALPPGQLWRHNQAGDLPGIGNRISARGLGALVEANRGKRGFTYTHKKLTAANVRHIEAANAAGFAINVSCNGLGHVDQVAASGIDAPLVTLLPSTAGKSTTTPAGRRVVTCPAYASPKTTCANCGLCARIDRDYVIGFPAHGNTRRRADKIATANSGVTT